ncbi:DNA cytosine methyltransferase [Mesorhizobium sp. SEMIA 3007]|uniref:DNA cytosine methyltransferase n=1 Tax=Mesorhizobium sp. SEMIA 3007 TaxID=1862350 RepID=UPI000A463814|nr:DNA cytosine methyltransferase [Mesorhizobium sp. SEMIA 3007]
MNLLNFEAPFVAQADYPPLIMDSFAGGGGASTGIEMALGRSPDIAINHNPAALALHEANHPQTLHLSENVYKVDPLDYVAGKHIGLAWFSPDCKHFSKAKGGKPVERNIRDLAWIIPGWVERIQDSGGSIDVVILENVEEFQDWGPLVDTERGLMPDPEARGQTFQKWCKALRRLGGKIEYRELRACDYGAPTIRKRLFVIIRFDGQKIVWPKPTHGKPDDPDVIAGRKVPWRTAAEIIDWSLPCPSIFDTTAEIMDKLGLRAVRPLADATMSRVARGVDRYVLKAKKPFLVNLTHGVRLETVEEPFNTITGAHRGEKAVVAPSVIRFNTGATGHDAREPLATVTANSFKKRPGGAAPLGILAPVLRTTNLKVGGTDSTNLGSAREAVVFEDHEAGLLNINPECQADENGGDDDGSGQNVLVHGPTVAGAATLIQIGYGEREGQAPRSLDIEVPLGTAGGVKHAMAVPTLVGCGGRAGQSRARSGDEPMATQTAKADVCVATAFLAQNNYQEPGHDAREPLSTIVQKGSTQSVVAASLISMKGSDRRDGPVGAPHPTVTAGGGKGGGTAVVAPHLMTMRNAGKPFNGADEPTHTITAGGAGISVVAPFMQKYYGTGDGARVDDPCHSVTTKDRFGFVEAECGWPPFTEAQAARARQVADFLRQHGFWDEREFVTVDIGGDTYTMIDIGMRMLTPRELFSAQGFPPDYVIEFEFNGKPLPKSDQIACCGNSVSPPMAAALVAANCGHLMRYQEAAE